MLKHSPTEGIKLIDVKVKSHVNQSCFRGYRVSWRSLAIHAGDWNCTMQYLLNILEIFASNFGILLVCILSTINLARWVPWVIPFKTWNILKYLLTTGSSMAKCSYYNKFWWCGKQFMVDFWNEISSIFRKLVVKAYLNGVSLEIFGQSTSLEIIVKWL